MRFKLIILFFISAIAIILGGRIIFSYIETRNFSKSGNRLPELRAIALVINEYKSQFKRYPANLAEIENYIKSSKFPSPNDPISRDIIYIMPEENGGNEVMLRCENVYGTFEYTVNNNAVYTKRKSSKMIDDSINLIGKSREEVINLLDTHSRYCYEDYGGMQNKIRISVNSVNKYYDSIDELEKDALVMENKIWGIMFKKTFLGESFFEIVFNENDIVISQKSFSLRDGP